MTRLIRNISSLVVAGIITAPVALYAQDRDHDRDDRTHRVYDPYQRDYHNWNGDEDRDQQVTRSIHCIVLSGFFEGRDG